MARGDRAVSNSVTARFGCAVGLAGALLFSLAESCDITPDQECGLSDEHCDGRYAVTCVPYEASAGSGTRYRRIDCGSAELCKTWEYGAFCSLVPDPDPRCGLFCDGQTRVDCQGDYPVSRVLCLQCSDDGTCTGAIGDSGCDAAHPCLPGLECSFGFCYLPCSCAAGTSCAGCAEAAKYSVYGGQTWSCKDQICQLSG